MVYTFKTMNICTKCHVDVATTAWQNYLKPKLKPSNGMTDVQEYNALLLSYGGISKLAAEGNIIGFDKQYLIYE